MAYKAPSTALTLLNIFPVTWQCSATGCPPTVTVPEGTVVLAVIDVLAKLASVVAKSAQLPEKLPPVAAESCGGGGSSVPQAETVTDDA